MTHRISKSQILAHIAAIADKSKVEDSDFLFFKDGIYKGEWNPNTSPNQLPTSKVPNAIYLVSENGSYFGKNLAVGELVRYDHDDKPILIYSKYLPISFFLSMVDEADTSVNTGFVFGGEWAIETTVTIQNATFSQLVDATIVNNTFTPTEQPSYAYARNILNSTPENGVTKQFKFTWPTLSPTDMFLICFVSSLNSEDISTLDFNQMFANPNTHILGMGYFATYASYFSLPNNQIILKKDGNNIPDVTNPSVFAQTGDDILMSLAGNGLTITNITQSTEMSLVFTSTDLDEQITLCIASSVAVEFSLDVQYPIQQSTSTVNIPDDANNKTYLVVSNDGSSVFDKVLKADDFVTFYDEASKIIVNRLYTDNDINALANTAINEALQVDGAIYNAIQSVIN